MSRKDAKAQRRGRQASRIFPEEQELTNCYAETAQSPLRSLVTQRDHRVDSGRPASWNVARQHRYASQQ